jgi:peptide/nickel transport system substrate-binding protein
MFGDLYESFTPVPHLADNAIGTLTSLGWADSNGDGVLDKDGIAFEFDLLVPSSSSARVRSAEIIQEQLRGYGIRMNIVEMEFTATFAQAKTGRFDAVFGALQHDPSPSSVTDSWTTAGFDGYNYGHYNNPNVVRLVDQAQTTPDIAEAKTLWERAFQTVIDDTPAIWVYVPEFAVALHTRLEGVSIRPDQWSATMWQWRVDPRNLLTRDVIGNN